MRTIQYVPCCSAEKRRSSALRGGKRTRLGVSLRRVDASSDSRRSEDLSRLVSWSAKAKNGNVPGVMSGANNNRRAEHS